MIKIIKNILTNKERKQLIEYSKPLLLTGEQLNQGSGTSDYPPSKQTRSGLYKNDKFKPIIDKILYRIKKEINIDFGVDKVWINYNRGRKEEQCWHIHPSGYAMVYYIKTFPFLNNGTCFRHRFVKAPQNSVLIFPAYMEHSVPSYPFNFERYTLSMDLNIVK